METALSFIRTNKTSIVLLLCVIVLTLVLLKANKSEMFAYSEPVSNIRTPIRGFWRSLANQAKPDDWKSMVDTCKRHLNTIESEGLINKLASEPENVKKLIESITSNMQQTFAKLQAQITCDSNGYNCAFADGSKADIRATLIQEHKGMYKSQLDELEQIAG